MYRILQIVNEIYKTMKRHFLFVLMAMVLLMGSGRAMAQSSEFTQANLEGIWLGGEDGDSLGP